MTALAGVDVGTTTAKGVAIDEHGPHFIERNVFLDTRRLDKGSHYPI